MSSSTISAGSFHMSSVIFDTLAYVKRLKAAGVPELQAEIQAETIAELINEKIATKQDLRFLEERLIYKITIRFGSMLIAAVTILAILIKIL